MRTFEKTHPWLSFQIDLRKAPYTLWHAFGEAQSKCENIAGVPLEPETAKSLHNIYLAKGALSTTAIEGNTLSEEEVRRRIAGGAWACPKQLPSQFITYFVLPVF